MWNGIVRAHALAPRGRVLLLLAGVIALPEPATAMQLRYKFRPGTSRTYRVMVAAGALARSPAAAQPMKMQFRMDLRAIQKVLSVSKSGVADVEMVNASGTMKTTAMGRSSSGETPREVSRLRLTDRGKLLSSRVVSSGDNAAAPASATPTGFDQADPLRALSGLNFPDRELKPGDSWTTESRVGLGNNRSVLMKIASRLVGLTLYKGRKCARVHTTFEMPMDTAGMDSERKGIAVSSRGKVAGEITTLFDYEAGEEVYADGFVTMLVKVQVSGSVDADSSTQPVDMTSAMKMNVRQILID